MESREEINKELESKLKRLEDDITSVIEYNSKLRAVLENVRREEAMTLDWLCECRRRDERTAAAAHPEDAVE